MVGTKQGAIKARDTNLKKYGQDYFKRMGRLGGVMSRGGGFASDKVGADGLTGRERAKVVGATGGRAKGKNFKKRNMEK